MPARPPSYRAQAWLRRGALTLLTFATTGWAAAQLSIVLAGNHGLGVLEIVLLALFVGCFVWIAFSFWAAIAGFAMRLARAILKSKPLEPYYDYEDFPGPDAQTDDELLAAAKERGTTTFHPMGTCRMGPDNDPTSVVDDELRVRGLEGLRVADSSIMPMMLSANLNAGVMMIADKASDLIRGKAAPQPIILR